MNPTNRKPDGEEESLESLLARAKVKEPDDLARSIMAAIAAERPVRACWSLRVGRFWPRTPRVWIGPALVGSVVCALITALVFTMQEKWVHPNSEAICVTFELHAPRAGSVELLGSFNAWQPGAIVLEGPDASGHWSVTVDLPPGQHEYVFLVDGKTWITDPKATILRPDGFGRENAVVQI